MPVPPAASAVRPSDAGAPRTRTAISIVLSPEVEGNRDAIACVVEAIQALPYVADVNIRKVRALPTSQVR